MSADTDKRNLNEPHGAGLSIESLDIDAERVDHLLIVKAFADALDLVGTVNRLVPTQMEVKPGLIVLGLVLDTLTGRSPLYRLVEFFEGRDTGLLLGESVPANVFTDDTTGRVLDLLFETGTQKIFSELAMKAVQKYEISPGVVHFDTTSVNVFGDYPVDESDPPPFEITHGYSKDHCRISSSFSSPLFASAAMFRSLERTRTETVRTRKSTIPFSLRSVHTWLSSE